MGVTLTSAFHKIQMAWSSPEHVNGRPEEQLQRDKKARKRLKLAYNQIKSAREEADALRKQLQSVTAAWNSEKKAFRRLLGNPPTAWTLEQRLFLMEVLLGAGSLTERDFHAALNGLIADRQLDVVESIIKDDGFGFDFVREYYKLRLSLYRGDANISLEQVRELHNRGRGSFLCARIRHAYLIQAIKRGADRDVEQILSEIDVDSLLKVTMPTIMGLCRFFIGRDRYATAAQLLSRYIGVGRLDQMLYFMEVLLPLYGGTGLRDELVEFCRRISGLSSEGIIDLLVQVREPVDTIDERVFQERIVQPLKSLCQHERSLLDVRFSQMERNALQQKIRVALEERRPLALVRLGDGEAYAYPIPLVSGIEPALFRNDSAAFERRWWGAAPPEEVKYTLLERVRQSVAQCDILGFPSVYRIIRDMPAPHQRYGRNRNQRAFLRLFAALGVDIPFEDKLVTEERCHRCAIDEEFIAELARLANSVVVVSCWPTNRFPAPFDKAEHINIPAACNVRAGPKKGRSLFEIYEDVVRRVSALSRPGTLVLVGAGIIGKVLVREARQGGAVALDVGSLLDYMVGVKSRSIGDVV